MKSIKCLLVSIFLLLVGSIARGFLEAQYLYGIDIISLILIVAGIFTGIMGCAIPITEKPEEIEE